MIARVFLEHAEELARDGRPAWCRSAISRAYYAAHHAAVDFLFRVGVRVPRDGTAHIAVAHCLVAVNGIEENVKEAGTDLIRLHRERNHADYRWRNVAVERQDVALDLVVDAREIIAALEDCLQDQDRADDVWNHYQTWVPAHGAALGLTLVR